MTRSTHQRFATVISVETSPSSSLRLQSHALSLSQHKFLVTLLAYEGLPLPQEFLQHPGITVHFLRGPSAPPQLQLWLFTFPLLNLLLKTFVVLPLQFLLQVVQLLFFFFAVLPAQELILVQSPPAFPIVAVIQGLAWASKAKLILDWTDLGYARMSLMPISPLRFLSKMYEQRVGHSAHAHLTSTRSLTLELSERWKVFPQPVLLYDAAPPSYRHLEKGEIHELVKRLEKEMDGFGEFHLSELSFGPTEGGKEASSGKEKGKANENSKHGNRIEETVFTEKFRDGMIQLKAKRPALVVATIAPSCTPKFPILIEALSAYEMKAQEAHKEGRDFACLIVVVLCHQVQKNSLLKILQRLDLQFVRLRVLSAKPEDRPLLMGAADFGINLSSSPSGLQIPPELSEMQGCSLPLSSIFFPTLRELFQNDEAGFSFTNHQQLAEQLVRLFERFPAEDGQLREMRKAMRKGREGRWDESWEKKVLPLLERS